MRLTRCRLRYRGEVIISVKLEIHNVDLILSQNFNIIPNIFYNLLHVFIQIQDVYIH